MVSQAIIKKHSRGEWEWKQLPANLLEGCEESRQDSNITKLWSWDKHNPYWAVYERQIAFFPHDIVEVDIMYVGMYNLNCIYGGEWEIGNVFCYEKQSVMMQCYFHAYY